MLHYAPLVAMEGADTEPVHQMRVATRRARSVIAALRPALASPELTAVDQDLKALSKVLGPARDWDVFTTETLPTIIAAFPGDVRLARLAKAAQVMRAQSHAALREWLTAADYRRLVVGLAWLTASPSWHPAREPPLQDLPAYATQILQHRWKKIASAGKTIDHLDAPDLHVLRLRAKRARYALEVLLSPGAGKPAHRMLRRLSALQAQLGNLNDTAVAASLLEQLGGRHGYASGLVLGFLAASATVIRARIPSAWKKFRTTPRFWA